MLGSPGQAEALSRLPLERVVYPDKGGNDQVLGVKIVKGLLAICMHRSPLFARTGPSGQVATKELHEHYKSSRPLLNLARGPRAPVFEIQR